MYRVCHLTSVHQRDDNRIVLKECVTLASVFEYVFCIVADGKGNQVYNNVHIIDVGNRPKSRFKRMMLTGRRVVDAAIALNADCYHIHDPELLFFVKRLSKKGAKVIYDAHEDLPKQLISKPYLSPFFAGLISHLAYYIENYYAKRVCLIIAATPSIARRFHGLNHIIVINNYPLFKEMFFTKSEITKKRQVCYIGGISEIRCITEIVEAAYLSKEKIVICGEFESEQLFNSVINKRGWEYIEYQGYLPVEDMINRMQSSMAGLLLFAPKANHIEAIPNKLFEYMASGIPVIASDFPNWHKIMSEYDCGVCVNPKNPKEIAMAIKMLLDDPKAASSMGKRGACAVQEKYNWESEAKLLIEGYRNLNWGMENV